MHTVTRALEVLGVLGAAVTVCAASWAVVGYRATQRDDRLHIRAGRQPIGWRHRVMIAAAAAGLTILIACAARMLLVVGGLL